MESKQSSGSGTSQEGKFQSSIIFIVSNPDWWIFNEKPL
jgi:hypothetical protein